MLFKIIYQGLDKFVVLAKNEIEARSIAFVKLSVDDFDEFYNMTVITIKEQKEMDYLETFIHNLTKR